MSTEIQILIAFTVLVGNAFFVGAEFGLVASRRSNIELQAANGSWSARVTLRAMERVSIMLAGAQLGITLCSLIFGAVGEPLLAHWLEGPFHAIGVPDAMLHPISFVLALIAMSYVHVVLGEMVPKNLALAEPSKVALWLTPLLVLFVKIMMPVVNGLNIIANGIVRLLGFTPKLEIASSFTRDEVAGFVAESHEEGLLSEDERVMLTGALSFDKKSIERITLPRKTLLTVTAKTTPEQLEALSAKSGFSRFPVVGKNRALVGYVHIKDILAVDESQLQQPLPESIVRELPEIRESASLRRALITMQRVGAHLAEVKDNAGHSRGIIALEDVIEELVGTLQDD